MQVGVIFPQSEIRADPNAIRDYTQSAEDLGYEYLQAYDHVLGADPSPSVKAGGDRPMRPCSMSH